jgi:type VI secretion system protein
MRNGLYYRIAVVCAFAWSLSACGASSKAGRTVGLRNNPPFLVHVNVANAANGNRPVAMDLVLVLDKKLVAEVAKLSAKDWFERRMQIQRDLPGKSEVVSWEWVPGQSAGPISVAVHPSTRGAFVFASYENAGDHRAAIDVRTPVVVQLQEERFSVQAIR